MAPRRREPSLEDMKFLAVPLLLTVCVLSACDTMGARSASDASAPAEVCSAAKPGTACDLVIAAGPPAIVAHCHKQDDGSLVCPGS